MSQPLGLHELVHSLCWSQAQGGFCQQIFNFYETFFFLTIIVIGEAFKMHVPARCKQFSVSVDHL